MFGIIHAGIRIAHLNATEKFAHASLTPDAQINVQKTVATLPMICNVASVATTFIIAWIIYAIGCGIRYGYASLIH